MTALAVLSNRPSPRIYRAARASTETKVGHLRLRRVGTTLHFLAAEKSGQEFREIFRTDYVSEDIEIVRFVVNTGDSPAAIDARLLDFKIEAAGSRMRFPATRKMKDGG